MPAHDLPADWHQREWRHFILSTYGSWLYGDPRGFRTRHHREHVEGDYKNPPPAGKYAEREQRSRQSLKRPPVVLAPKWRAIAGKAFVNRLTGLGAYVACAAVSGQHLHVLAKIPRGTCRAWAAAAKRHVWFEMRANGWQGRLWAKRGRAVLVSNRQHHQNAIRYILDHVKQGAWVWRRPMS